jgi:hypothetical protein
MRRRVPVALTPSPDHGSARYRCIWQALAEAGREKGCEGKEGTLLAYGLSVDAIRWTAFATSGMNRIKA